MFFKDKNMEKNAEVIMISVFELMSFLKKEKAIEINRDKSKIKKEEEERR